MNYEAFVTYVLLEWVYSQTMHNSSDNFIMGSFLLLIWSMCKWVELDAIQQNVLTL